MAAEMKARRRLVIYHTGDIHGRRGFGARLAAVVEPDSLLVDAGDSLAGSATMYRAAEPVIADLRQAPYNAQAVGNREFHYLHRNFLRRARLLPAPLVCSNLIDLGGRAEVFRRELMVGVAGLQVRVLGLIVPQYRTGSGWEKVFGWRFLSADTALDEMLGARARTADATIVLSHLGLRADRIIAHRWHALTAIVGGHSHDLLPQPEVIDGIPIVHAGAYAGYVGRLALSVQDGAAVDCDYQLIPLLADSAPERKASAI